MLYSEDQGFSLRLQRAQAPCRSEQGYISTENLKMLVAGGDEKHIYHKVPLHVAVKTPSSRIVCLVSISIMSMVPLSLRIPKHGTYLITAQPNAGRSAVSRYEGFSRLIMENGASIAEEYGNAPISELKTQNLCPCKCMG